jgi:hypothetical protein
MLINELFSRDIFRPINGVVKADQLDESSVWQELDEFVITKELGSHFTRFFSAYTDSLDRPNDPDIAGRIGVWVSGFFGSGKSHFIKVLSYLLANAEHSYNGRTRRAVDFFEEKVADAILFADIKRSVASNVDVILFNIDSKADHRAGRDAILQVFLKVLNEAQGYSPDHPHIAHMERYLGSKKKLEEFHRQYRDATGTEWTEERDAYEFNRDEVVQALSATLSQSPETAQTWIDNAEKNFALTVENFCKWVREYLDARGDDHRVLFMADEVGQFIAGDTHLMLNLQTISEQLGTACGGRAWIIVTSQEDMDAVLGEMKTTKSNDFSKIQGRFKTRLSLSSANVDEVIQARLLAKNEDAVEALQSIYSEKGDVLKNQLTFVDCGMTFRSFEDASDFVKNYPFIPYQFQLVQKIFEAIRKAGATGLHLARGERSLLDAFQAAGKQLAASKLGVLAPLYRFYPSIESFLDTTVKKTIDQAANNPDLDPFDIELLKVLFLIRYVEEMKAKVDNLVTLCLDAIDADRLGLRRQIEESLQRLEKQTLISRSGDVYSFLTNEERDISREIKNVELSSGEEAKLLGELVFEDVLRGQRKHRYSANKMDYTLNRMCDRHPIGNQVDKGLLVSVISPLADDYDLYDKGRCVLESQSQHDGHVLIKLGNEERLGREIRNYLQTAKYVGLKDDSTLPETTRRILREFSEDNRLRRERLVSRIGQMLTVGEHFVAGQPRTASAATPAAAFDDSLEYLIQNTFTKMSYLKQLRENPAKEIQAVLRSNDIEQQAQLLKLPEANPQAIEEVSSYIELCASTSKQVVLYDMIDSRFAKRPYGWPPLETALLVARLLVLGELSLVLDGATVPPEQAYELLTTPSKQRRVIVIKRKTTDPAMLQQARSLGKDVFAEMGPDGEDALFIHLQRKLKAWQTQLSRFKPLADTGTYPGATEIDEGLSLIGRLLKPEDSYQFIERFNENKSDLLALHDQYHDLENFYSHQKTMWDRIRKAAERFELNRLELHRDEDAASALKRIQEILGAPAPYALIKEADSLIATVESVNAALIEARRSEATDTINGYTEMLKPDIATTGDDSTLSQACLGPLERLCDQVKQLESVAHISQAEAEALAAFDSAIKRIEEFVAKKPDEPTTGGEPPKPSVKPQRIIRPTELTSQTYLETSAEIDAFLASLKKQLEEAIARNERIQIR